MDVEMQMEASGLPLSFASTSEQPQESHIAENVAASVSNAEASVHSDVTKPAPAEVMPQQQPSEPAYSAAQELLAEEEKEPAALDITSPVTNGIKPAAETAETIVSSTIEYPSLPPEPAPAPAPDSTTATASFYPEAIIAEPLIPSSVAPEIPSITQTDVAQPDSSAPEPMSGIPHPPTSDLRTSPHADALSAEAVAQIEEEKHEMDNAADAIQTPAEIPPVTTSFSSELPAPPTHTAGESSLSNIGLPSPPGHSPHPQPAEAMVEDKPAATIDALGEIPAEPAPTPVVAASSESQDLPMTDAPPAKVAREREEDPDDVPSAKRVKTEEPIAKPDGQDFKVPDIPAAAGASSPAVTNGDSVSARATPDTDDTITPPRLAHMKKVISNLKKSNASANFRQPVDYVTLNIPSYPEIIKRPMDLSKIDLNLKQNQYSGVSEFVADFDQIITNCVTFNGREHGVTQLALKMDSSFKSQMKNLPRANAEETTKEAKKAAKKQEPTRVAPPRRPSVSTNIQSTGTAGSPKSAAAPATPSFAPGPDGVPLIRRDSSLQDGRPKRQIIPPKRNQELGSGRPRKKKYGLQLKFCEEVIKELMLPKHWQINQYFLQPVDPVALNIPTYFQIIKKPMDLSTMAKKLENNEYEKAKDFEADVRQIVANCFKFNVEGDLVWQSGESLLDLFEKKWATKDQWIAEREPQSEPASEEDEDDDAESEEDADEEEEERNEKLKALQKQMAEMQKQMEMLQEPVKTKKSKSPPSKAKKAKASKKEKQPSMFPNLGKEKKEKKKPASKPKAERFVTFAEKQYISNGIAMLPEAQMQQALKIIQQSVPSLANSAESEIELDIEEVPNHALLKLLGFVSKYAGPPPDEPKAHDSYGVSAPGKTKKNKPMSKQEQDAQLQALRGNLGGFNGGPISPNAVQSIENDSSDDDDGESDESEEE